jgi:hypothetical protein
MANNGNSYQLLVVAPMMITLTVLNCYHWHHAQLLHHLPQQSPVNKDQYLYEDFQLAHSNK